MSAAGYLLPLLVAAILLPALWKRVPIFDTFLEGATENLKLSVELLPTLIALMMALGALRASGGITLLQELLAPLLTQLGFPAECVPLALLRPISGSGSLAVYASILETSGPDSFAGLVASVMQGASETTLYTIALYYGATGIRRGRHTLLCALAGDCAVFVVSTLLVRLMLLR